MIIRNSREHCRDQFRIGWKRDVFLRTGMNRSHRRARIGPGAAGDDRHVDLLGFKASHQLANVDRHFDHHQVRATPGAQDAQSLLDGLRMRDACAFVHRDLGRNGELSVQCSDDQKAHGMNPSFCLSARLDSELQWIEFTRPGCLR
jgi:hypothetical protein